MSGARFWGRFAIWHAGGSAAVSLLISARYFHISPLPDDALGLLFVALALPSLVLLLALVASLPVALAALLRPGRVIALLSVLLQASFLFAIAIDTQVYSLYRSHLDGMLIGLATSRFALDVLQPTPADLLQLATLLGCVIGITAALAFPALELARRSRLSPAWLLVAMIVPFAAANGLHAFADVRLLPSIPRAARVLPWLPALTAKRWLTAQGLATPGVGAAATLSARASDIAYPLASPDCHARAGDVRILMIVIEQWRFDQLDATTTPNLWRFAAESLVLEHHFSAGNASRYGVFGLFYGLHGDYWDAMLAEQRGPVLIDELLKLDVRFFIAASAPLARPEFDRTAFARLRGRVPFVQPVGPPSNADALITEAFVAFAAEVHEDPFFAFLYYDSPHSMDIPPGWEGPYAPAQQWGSRLALGPETDPVPLEHGHLNSVHYVDSRIGLVLDALQRNGLLERTAIVITGDHGEEFNELGQNYWGHNGNFSRFQTQVAMVLRIPGRGHARVKSLTSHTDIVPTLMQEILDCRAEVRTYSNGSPVTGSLHPPYVVASGGSLGVGIIEPARITVIDRFGDVTVRTPDWQEEAAAAADPVLLRRVFEELTLFRGAAR